MIDDETWVCQMETKAHTLAAADNPHSDENRRQALAVIKETDARLFPYPSTLSERHIERIIAVKTLLGTRVFGLTATTFRVSLDLLNQVVEHLMHDGTRNGLILANELNMALGASARRNAMRDDAPAP